MVTRAYCLVIKRGTSWTLLTIYLAFKPLPHLHSCRSLAIVRVKMFGYRFVIISILSYLISGLALRNGWSRLLEAIPVLFRH